MKQDLGTCGGALGMRRARLTLPLAPFPTCPSLKKFGSSALKNRCPLKRQGGVHGTIQ